MQPVRKKNLMAASLRDYPDARSVLLRMAQDAERARRIRKLKGLRPALKWRQVAEAVGVAERTVASWAAKGQIGYENCEKLADFFGVDRDWLFSGRRKDAADSATLPDVDQDALSRLASIERKLDQLMAFVLGSRFEEELEAADEQDEQQDGNTDADAEDPPEEDQGS